jgi:hypothetical protein
MSDTKTDAPYVFAIPVTEIFADHGYQRLLDRKRAEHMAATFDERLLGIIELSDRGEDQHPRYAVIEGQHRWAALTLRQPHGAIAASIHTDLTPAEEARLFHDIDAQRRRLSTWDRWKARRAQHEPAVTAIEATVARIGLRVDDAPKDGSGRRTSTLEKIARSRGGRTLLKDSLQLLHDTWGQQQAAYDMALVAGMALFLDEFGDQETFECEHLVDALIDLAPNKVAFFAREKKANGNHGGGALAKFVALLFVERYNTYRPADLKLSTPHTCRAAWRRVAVSTGSRSRMNSPAPDPSRPARSRHSQTTEDAALQQVTGAPVRRDDGINTRCRY